MGNDPEREILTFTEAHEVAMRIAQEAEERRMKFFENDPDAWDPSDWQEDEDE